MPRAAPRLLLGPEQVCFLPFTPPLPRKPTSFLSPCVSASPNLTRAWLPSVPCGQQCHHATVPETGGVEMKNSRCLEEPTNTSVCSGGYSAAPEAGAGRGGRLTSMQSLLTTLQPASPRSQGGVLGEAFLSACTQSELRSLLFLEGRRYGHSTSLLTPSAPTSSRRPRFSSPRPMGSRDPMYAWGGGDKDTLSDFLFLLH